MASLIIFFAIFLNFNLQVITTQQEVIDIFTNYPNTQEALQDYNKLLEHRGNLIKDNQVESRTNSKQSSDLPRVITAKASTDIEFQTRTNPSNRRRFNYYQYQPAENYPDEFDHHPYNENLEHQDQWSNFHDFHNPTIEKPPNDILESEFGVFEHPKNTFHEENSMETQEHPIHLLADIGKPHNSPNMFDLSNLVEVRPSFLTSGSFQSHKNRINKTAINNNDHIDFDQDQIIQNPNFASLESDFGEIVSTTIDKYNKRKGSIKRIKKPQKFPEENQEENQNSEEGHNESQNYINPNHIANLYQQSTLPGNNKQKVTNLIRKYLIKMKNNGTTKGHKFSGSYRRNRKQSTNNNDRTFNNLFNDKKTQMETNVKLHEGQEKFLFDSDYSGHFENFKNKTKLIANKFLSLFTIVQFSNFHCQANSAVTQYEGICYLASECSERNGIAMGMCAEGYGVCCVFRGTCGGVGSNNCTYFESPGYPNYFPLDGGVVLPTSTTSNPLTPDPRLRKPGSLYYPESRQNEQANALSCIFKIYKANDNVRQMRIDFIDLELTGPTAGNCVDERLIISGSGLSTGVPPICGYNSGQHVYVDVSTLSGPLQLAVLANMIARKRYKLRICQYEDGCSGLMNCLQYYTGITGMIQSFNYDQAATFSRSMPGYFNNLNYAICIRREPGYCTITYTNVGPNGVVYPFELRNYDDGVLTVPAGQAGAGVINCPDDYIVIDGVRLCGDRLNDGSVNDDFTRNAPVTDTSGGPIVIPVRTNANNTSRGFKLFYTQNPCGSSGGAAGTPDPRI